jgi:hypothetical protein
MQGSSVRRSAARWVQGSLDGAAQLSWDVAKLRWDLSETASMTMYECEYERKNKYRYYTKSSGPELLYYDTSRKPN